MAGRARHCGLHLIGSRFTRAAKDLEDFALAARELFNHIDSSCYIRSMPHL
jgi:hypothetical protein